MRSYNYNLKRLGQHEIAGPATANALIDFCLGVSSTSKYLIINPNGRGSVNFELDEGGLMADILSQLDGLGGGYDGPFKLTTTGVESGKVVVPDGSVLDIDACEYENMTRRTSTGFVQLVVKDHGGYYTGTWYISSSYVSEEDAWTIIVGNWDGTTPYQRFYGDAYIYTGAAGDDEYNGPFKLWATESSGTWSLQTNGGDVYNLDPYSGSATTPMLAVPATSWTLPENPSNTDLRAVVLRMTSTGPVLSMVTYPYTVPANEIAIIGYAWPYIVWDEQSNQHLDHWEIVQYFQWGKSDIYWKQSWSFSQTNLLSAQNPGLYVSVYVGAFGCWPISDHEVFMKGGTLTRRWSGNAAANVSTVIADTTYDLSQATTENYLAMLPYQNGAVAGGPMHSSSAAATANCLFIQADFGVYNGALSYFRQYAFRDGKGLGSKTTIYTASATGMTITMTWHLEAYDDSNLVYHYNWPSQHQVIPITYGIRQELFWASTNHQSNTYASQGVFVRSGDTGSNGVGGYSTKLAHWTIAQGTPRWQFTLQDDYTSTGDSPSGTIPYFGVGWRSAGDILLSGGRIDCGWTNLSVDPTTISVPSSTSYVWITVTYTPGSSGAGGTLSYSWGNGASVPSSTATTQVVQLAQISVGSNGVARITAQSGFPDINDDTLSRYCQTFLCCRCL